jgi:hypothetical protein
MMHVLVYLALVLFMACLVALVVIYVRAFRALPRYKRTDNQTF